MRLAARSLALCLALAAPVLAQPLAEGVVTASVENLYSAPDPAKDVVSQALMAGPDMDTPGASWLTIRIRLVMAPQTYPGETEKGSAEGASAWGGGGGSGRLPKRLRRFPRSAGGGDGSRCCM